MPRLPAIIYSGSDRSHGWSNKFFKLQQNRNTPSLGPREVSPWPGDVPHPFEFHLLHALHLIFIHSSKRHRSNILTLGSVDANPQHVSTHLNQKICNLTKLTPPRPQYPIQQISYFPAHFFCLLGVHTRLAAATIPNSRLTLAERMSLADGHFGIRIRNDRSVNVLRLAYGIATPSFRNVPRTDRTTERDLRWKFPGARDVSGHDVVNAGN
jgi:hypothetical protein